MLIRLIFIEHLPWSRLCSKHLTCIKSPTTVHHLIRSLQVKELRHREIDYLVKVIELTNWDHKLGRQTVEPTALITTLYCSSYRFIVIHIIVRGGREQKEEEIGFNS